MHLTLIPAYGRDYKSKAEVVADLLALKDFEVVSIGNAGYMGLPELTQLVFDKGTPQGINVRYKKRQNVAVLTIHSDHILMDGKKIPFTSEVGTP
jgi:hypothetical protein